jgi:hypothetical protein
LPNERVFFDEPIAIWKRNGDVMRRYEVWKNKDYLKKQ